MHPLRPAGHTLLELLATLALLASLLAAGLPSFVELRSRWLLQTGTSALLSGLARARLEALARGEETWLCPSNDGRVCAPGAARGFIVQAQHGGSSSLLRSVLLGGSLSFAANRPETRFHPWPRAASTVTWTLCPSAGRLAQRVVVSQAGRPRVEAAPACN